MRKFNVSLEEVKVEQLRDAARRRAVRARKDVTWLDLLREATDKLLAEEVPAVESIHVGGTR